MYILRLLLRHVSDLGTTTKTVRGGAGNQTGSETESGIGLEVEVEVLRKPLKPEIEIETETEKDGPVIGRAGGTAQARLDALVNTANDTGIASVRAHGQEAGRHPI